MEPQRQEHAVHRLVGQRQGFCLAQDPPEWQGVGVGRRMAHQVGRYIQADDLGLEPLRQRPRKASRATLEIEHSVLGCEPHKLDKVRKPQIEQLGAKAGIKCEGIIGGRLCPICLHETPHF
jgi:hypothetical protein